jgi:hypothetical protein
LRAAARRARHDSPWLAAIGMSLSSIAVVLNAMRLSAMVALASQISGILPANPGRMT